MLAYKRKSMIKKPMAGGLMSDGSDGFSLDGSFNPERIAEEKLAIARREENRRKEEALLIEKGVAVNKKTNIEEQKEKSLLEVAWKYLFQHLFEECISHNTKDNPNLIDSTFRLFKMIKEFRAAAIEHVKEIINEFSLPLKLRIHEQYCTRFYGPTLKEKSLQEAGREIPSLLVFRDPRYTVQMAVPQIVGKVAILISKGLEDEVIDDDIVSSVDQ